MNHERVEELINEAWLDGWFTSQSNKPVGFSMEIAKDRCVKRLALRATEPEKHYFTPMEGNDRFCDACGNYLTHELHFRAAQEGQP